MAADTKTVNLYNPHNGLTGRDGGPYLDQEEARLAEERRARIENREPDYDNLPATAGIPLVTAGQLVAMSANVHVPSQENNSSNPIVDAVAKVVDNDDFPVNTHSKVELTDASKAPEYNPANPTLVSTDDGPLGVPDSTTGDDADLPENQPKEESNPTPTFPTVSSE